MVFVQLMDRGCSRYKEQGSGVASRRDFRILSDRGCASKKIMAAYRYRCPHCGDPFAVETDALGRAVACPLCRGVVQIPESAVESVSDPAMPEAPNAVRNPAVPSFPFPPADGGTMLPDPMAPVSVDHDAEIAADAAMTDSVIEVEDRPKTIVYKGRTIELRKVSPEEKRRRRWRRRIVLLLISSGVLIYYLLRGAGKI